MLASGSDVVYASVVKGVWSCEVVGLYKKLVGANFIPLN